MFWTGRLKCCKKCLFSRNSIPTEDQEDLGGSEVTTNDIKVDLEKQTFEGNQESTAWGQEDRLSGLTPEPSPSHLRLLTPGSGLSGVKAQRQGESLAPRLLMSVVLRGRVPGLGQGPQPLGGGLGEVCLRLVNSLTCYRHCLPTQAWWQVGTQDATHPHSRQLWLCPHPVPLRTLCWEGAWA